MSIDASRFLPPTLLSSHEVSKARHYLASTRDRLLEAVSGLSPSQWHFTPEPDRWSIGEILEHVVRIEEGVHGIVGQMAEAPSAEAGRIDSQIDEVVLAEVPVRVKSFPAPPAFWPLHQWSADEVEARFLATRHRTSELLETAPYLRGRVVPHPILGPWDGYQWILAAAAHSARHTDQIIEVKASTRFPKLDVI